MAVPGHGPLPCVFQGSACGSDSMAFDVNMQTMFVVSQPIRWDRGSHATFSPKTRHISDLRVYCGTFTRFPSARSPVYKCVFPAQSLVALCRFSCYFFATGCLPQKSLSFPPPPEKSVIFVSFHTLCRQFSVVNCAEIPCLSAVGDA